MAEEYIGPKFKTFFTSELPPVHDGIKKLILWGRKFSLLGLTPSYEFGAAGNLSCRTDLGFIVTGAGVELGSLKESDFCEVLDCDLEKKEVVAKGKVDPSSETMMHYAIYKQRKEVNVVFHVHDDYATDNCDSLGLRCTANEKPYGSIDLIKEVLEVIENHDYVVMKQHGIISLGVRFEDAGQRILDVNKKIKE